MENLITMSGFTFMCWKGLTHFQFTLKQLHTGDEMCNTSLIQSICDSLFSQCGIECHHCCEYKTPSEQKHINSS